METKEVEGKIGDYWNEYASKFDAEHDTEDLELWSRALESCLGADDPSTVLDLGTGTGFLVNLAAKQGHFCAGLDLAPKMLEIAVEKTRAMNLKAVYLKGSVLDLPFAENSFDFIVNARLLWTLVEPQKTAAHWVRFLRPGGKLVCFNRYKEGLGMCGGQEVYGQKGMDEAITLAHASSADLIALFQGCGLAEVEFRRLPDLTKPDRREGLDEWHALMGRKPL